MATLQDLRVSAFINIVGAFVFLLLFAFLRIQPINDRVYFPKLYNAKQQRAHDAHRGARRAINLNLCTYFKFLSWVPGALRTNQTELIQHAGLDSVVYLRIYTLGQDVKGISDGRALFSDCCIIFSIKNRYVLRPIRAYLMQWVKET